MECRHGNCINVPICAPRSVCSTVAEDEIRQNVAVAFTMPMATTSITQIQLYYFLCVRITLLLFTFAQNENGLAAQHFAPNRLFFNQIQIQALTQRCKTPIIIITYFQLIFFAFLSLHQFFLLIVWWAHFFGSHFEKWISQRCVSAIAKFVQFRWNVYV